MSIKYQIWFTWNAEREKIRLPVLPEKFSIKNGSNNQSIDLTGLGEITIMQSRPALQFSFFPAFSRQAISPASSPSSPCRLSSTSA